ncbi:LuxR C-terminal-related transcriptional regulator [Streptomyces sp. S.PB5]|uniref:LuxR C-terminal-related transcriptional regulator n=1 Tax=Streptomyces sp. S.PB5 TaxID=3020844 RepID=UPI0025B1B8DE|nr:LuxR C-terminal-related transcriptional regulator [Streptomyces sp. S.PB5]MDN3020417.1 LuxR C-terminal-related transcriptional regulator [Streptomyces sp. S.PB5]
MGRRDEAAEVRRLLSVGRLLTLTGPGGVGKTRLAGHVARQVGRVFPDGVWLVPLAALQDEAFVPHAVLEALGVRNETTRPPLDVLVEYLRERQLLIVLDNCEHVLRSCAVLAAAVLSATEGVRILATSRHRLGLAGEQLFEVPPLPAPTPEEAAGGALATERFPALRLFADRAAAVVPGFTLEGGNQQAVARLCRRLDGLPLAIELAAVRVRALGVEQLVERLDDRYRLLTGGSPVSPPRHRTLRSAVDWSHELCTPQEQLVWAWLSVFVGGFDLAAAEAVCGGEGLGSADVLDAVAGLVDKSVLVREEFGRQVRFRLLVSLRDYGREKLEDLGEVTGTRRRHRDHFARLATGYERNWFGPDQPEITERLRLDRDNFHAALDFCLTTPGEAQHGLRMASSLWFHWVAGGVWGQGRHWMDGALRAGAHPDVALTRAMWAGALMSLVHTRSAAVLAGTTPGTGSGSGTGPGTSLGPGPGTGSGPGAGSGTGTGSGTGPSPSPGPGPGTGSGPGAGSGSGTGPGTSLGPGPSTGSGPGAGSGSGAGSGTGPSPGPGAGSGPGAGRGSGPGPGTGSGPGPGSGSGTGPSPSPGTGPVTGKNPGPGSAADDELPVPTPPPVPAEAFAPGNRGSSTASFIVLTRVELACTLVCRGRPEEAIPLCAEAIALCEAHGEQWARGWALRTLALAYWAVGDYGRAAEHARTCLRLPYTGQHAQSLARTLDLLAAAEAMTAAGAVERAGVLRGAVDRIWRDIGGDPVESFRPGRTRVAERHARESSGDAAYERAHRRGGGLSMEEAVAYALGEVREPAPARPPAGAVPVPVPSMAMPVPDDALLTPREAQVASLIAQGRTNRQIAESLVIAQRTAEGHVERILAKLGFTNRSQVAAWFSTRRVDDGV